MAIPVYQVTIPEYKVKKLKEDGRYFTLDHFWKSMKIPKVYEDNKPDFDYIGAKIDKCLKRHFLNKKVAIRVLSSDEHKGKTQEDLIKIIKKKGYDRYDPKRIGDRYENINNLHIDFFAIDFKVRKNSEYFKHFLVPFYYWPLIDRQKMVRVDIAIIYDLSKLKMVKHRYKGRESELKKEGFVFKDPKHKPDAILGIIKIL